MPSDGNYPFQAIIGGAETWIYTEARTTPDTLLAGNRLANGYIGYIPDPRATGVLFQMQNQDIAGSGYGFKIDTSEAGYFTVKIIQISDNTVIDTAKLNNSVISDSITWSKINFWITVDNTEEPAKIGKCGIGGEYLGTFPQTPEGGLIPVDMPVDNYSFVEFTGAGTAAIINSWCEIRQISNYYGHVINVLRESDNFEITKLPGNLYNEKETWDQSSVYSHIVIPVDEDPDIYDLNAGFIEFLSQHDYFKDLNPYSLAAKFGNLYTDAIGSDMLRRNSDGTFTNGVDLNQSNLIFPPAESSDPYIINFSGGKIQLKTNNSGTRREVILLDSDDSIIDRAALNYPTSGGASAIIPGSVRLDPAYPGDMSVYLGQDGSNFYLISLRQYKSLYDDNGNQITFPGTLGNVYSGGCFYSIIHKFNAQASEILENASDVITEYDLTDIDDNSPEASTGDNAQDGYDRNTEWSAGPEAGTNNGIRHNGEENIDASDLEQTRADQYEGIKQPDESGENKIPTPLNTGMIKAFAPSDEELEKFGMDLNSDSFASTIRNYFNNPMDVIISCHTCIAPALSAGAECYLTYGNWTSQSAATPYSMHVLNQMYYRVAYGELNLSEITNDWRFYERQKLSIYLPWIGVRDIDPKLLNGKLLKLYYNINVLTGDILAELKAQNEKTSHLDTYYVWSGNTLSQMPLKSTDYSAMLSGAISTTLSTVTAMGGALAGNPLSMFGSINALQRQPVHPDIKLQGTFTGGTCAFMTKTPMILRQYPYGLNKKPYLYNRLKGLPGNIGTNILNSYNSLSGTFIKLEAIDLSDIYTAHNTQASEAEKLELERLLKTGVYI